MAALIREPPTPAARAARSSLRSSPTSSTSPRSRASPAAAATARRPASRASARSTRSPSSSCASSSRRRRRAIALTGRSARGVAEGPSRAGIVLVDKPAGPSSFAVVAERARTTGHEGRPRRHARPVRDRAAACCLSGRRRGWRVLRRARQALPDARSTSRCARRPATRRASVERRSRRRAASSRRARGPPRRGRAADPGRLGREDRRRARVPAAPARRRGGDADPPLARPRARRLAYTRRHRDARPARQLGTYVRAIADALGGHCVRSAGPRSARSASTTPTRSGW